MGHRMVANLVHFDAHRASKMPFGVLTAMTTFFIHDHNYTKAQTGGGEARQKAKGSGRGQGRWSVFRPLQHHGRDPEACRSACGTAEGYFLAETCAYICKTCTRLPISSNAFFFPRPSSTCAWRALMQRS